jgi:hypothetical protein
VIRLRYYDLRGLRRFESSKSTDREEAEKLLRKRLTAKDAGLQPEAAIGKLTLKEALTDVENDYTTNGKKSLKDAAADQAHRHRLDVQAEGHQGRVLPAKAKSIG